MGKIHCIECIHFALCGKLRHTVLENGIGLCSENKGIYKSGAFTTLFNSCEEGKPGINDYERLKRKREGDTKKGCSG